MFQTKTFMLRSGINEWNAKAEEVTGYKKDEVVKCDFVEMFVPPNVQKSMKNVFDGALHGRGTSNFQTVLKTKSNGMRHITLNATTRRNTDKNVVEIVCVAQDVTELVKRDHEIASMVLELRQLIETAVAPIFGIDSNGNVNEWNNRTQTITGYSKDEIFGEPLVERFIAPSMQRTVEEMFLSALQGNPTSNREVEFVAKDGCSRFLLINATPRRDSEFNIVGGKVLSFFSPFLLSPDLMRFLLSRQCRPRCYRG